MKKTVMAVALGALAAGMTGFTVAGPEKVKFPSDYLKGTLYATVDRPDTKQYRELYASPGTLESVRAGKGVPSTGPRSATANGSIRRSRLPASSTQSRITTRASSATCRMPSWTT